MENNAKHCTDTSGERSPSCVRGVAQADRGVCLADYCDILRCDVLGPRLAAAERASAGGSAVATALQPDKPKEAASGGRCGEPPADHPRCSCDQKHMSALQQKCRVRAPGMLCGALIIMHYELSHCARAPVDSK